MSEDTKNNIISEATPVRIGLILAFLGAFGSAVWWGSSITNKLDTLLTFQKTTDTSIIELKAKDIALDKQITDIKSFNDKDLSEIKLKIALTEVELKAVKSKLLITN